MRMADKQDVEALFEKEAADREKIADSKEWKPKEDDVLYGTLLDGRWVNTDHGPTKVLNVEDSDGQVWTVWAGRKMLSDAVDKAAPRIGTEVGVKYGGKKEPKKPGGYGYHFYQFHSTDADRDYWNNEYEALSGIPQQGSGIAPDADGGLARPF